MGDCCSCCVTCLTCGCVKDCLDWVTRSNTDYEPRLETEYHHILKFKGEKAVWYKPPNSKLSIAQLKYRSDLVSKVVYHNDWKDDFITYARNAHAYFSPWMAARLHPFSRTERLIVVILSVISSLSLAMFRAGMVSQQRDQYRSKGGTPSPTIEGQADQDQAVTATKTTFDIINPILLFIFTTILTYLGTCQCAQGTKCASCRGMCEGMAHLAMCTFSCGWIITFLVLGITAVSLYGFNAGGFFLNFFLNIILSAFVTAPILAAAFYEYYRRSEIKYQLDFEEKLKEGKKAKQAYYVPYPWWEEWRDAGFPTFDGDGPLTEEEKEHANGRYLNLAKKGTEMATEMAHTIRSKALSPRSGSSKKVATPRPFDDDDEFVGDEKEKQAEKANQEILSDPEIQIGVVEMSRSFE